MGPMEVEGEMLEEMLMVLETEVLEKEELDLLEVLEV